MLPNQWHLATILSTIMLTLILVLPVVECSYDKVQFLSIDSPITSITNCKISSNTIFTTPTHLNYWISYQKLQQILLPSQSPTHKLTCSRYANRLQHAYIAVLDGNGTVTVWQEIVSSFYVGVEGVAFGAGRDGKVGDVAVGGVYLGLGYLGLGVVDVYDLEHGGVLVKTVRFQQQIVAMMIDNLGNLITVCHQNGTHKLMLHQIYSQVSLQIQLPYLNSSQKLTLDYSQPLQTDPFLLKYLISTYTLSLTTTLLQSPTLSLTPPTVISQNHNLQQLCDQQLTYLSPSSPTSLQKQQDGIILTLDNPILMYTCTTDTGVYVYSEFFAVSRDDVGKYYVDCYYSVNLVLDYLIGFGMIFCCVCVRIFASLGARGCRCVGTGLVFFYYLFCWCPTRESMDQIQEKLQR